MTKSLVREGDLGGHRWIHRGDVQSFDSQGESGLNSSSPGATLRSAQHWKEEVEPKRPELSDRNEVHTRRQVKSRRMPLVTSTGRHWGTGSV